MTSPKHNLSPEFSSDAACPVCSQKTIVTFLDVTAIPIQTNVLWEKQSDAIATPRGDLHLGFCETCGHIYNLAFNPRLMEYDAAYENSLHFSPRFQSYAKALAAELVLRHDLYGKKIIEIGSGKGDFLHLLCEAGHNQGVGFDPSYDGAGSPFQDIRFVQSYFSEEYAGEVAEFICSRHTLEHIPQPTGFLQMLRRAVADRPTAVIFMEVPNVRYTLDELAIWDLIYEHVSYFSPASLSYLFRANGFDICRVSETYEGQFLTLEAVPSGQVWGKDLLPGEYTSSNLPHTAAELRPNVTSFASRFQEKTTTWRARLDAMKAQGQRVVLWGAGSKGISFLNFLKVQDEVGYVVDINPRKRHKFISGSGQQIVPPDFLKEYRPDTVIIMNPIYRDEIRQTLANLNSNAEILVA